MDSTNFYAGSILAPTHLSNPGDMDTSDTIVQGSSVPRDRDSSITTCSSSGPPASELALLQTTAQDPPKTSARSGQAPRAQQRAKPVKVACARCQKMKTKCSGERPNCRSCKCRGFTCSWEIADGVTRTADLKRQIEEATNRSEDLGTLVEELRSSTDQNATMLLAKLRLGASVKDLIHSIRSRSPGSDSSNMPS